ncbi:leucine-rich repeat protein [Butyrivibrio sp. VCD2006]|uniref:leucine-rich repeat protein n=1 Tax=Butyrivibrio sp. VCD2006 TaxID=1280664 RepID=UPI00047CC410|nr:leucine-rich repeat protein [Butyrivibrio sp. VCD2006]
MNRGKNLIINKFLILFLSVSIFCNYNISAQAAGTTTYQVTGNYLQTSARNMLATINQLRTSGNAWEYDENNNKVNIGVRSALQYDYTLEKIAMQRAMEISVRYGHERPDGTLCSTAYPAGLNSWWGENILCGSYDIDTLEAFNMWLEENEDYDGQGHRRNMLSSNFAAIGIGHVERDGCHFWVQEFLGKTTTAAATAALDGPSTVPVEVDNSYIRLFISDEEGYNRINLTFGDSYDLSGIKECITAAVTSIEPPIVKIPASAVTSSDTSIASISGNRLVANNVGTTTLSATSSLGTTASITVRVSARSLFGASMTFDRTSYQYTGNPIVPVITLTCDGRTLTEGVDYTVALSNNTSVGYGMATITGIGNYRGTMSRSFTISRNSSSGNQNGNNSDGVDSSSGLDEIQDDDDTVVINHIGYTIKGQNAEVIGCTTNITSYTAPKYITVSGKKYKVTSIGKYAFAGLCSLKKLDLSKSEITKIGANAFYRCFNLQTVKLNASKQKTIGKNAFKDAAYYGKCIIKAKNKSAYNKLVKKLKKAGMKYTNFKKK